MENRNPRLNLGLVPVGGIDRKISCDLCPSACCRKGMKLRLSEAEADTLREAGTVLEKVKVRRGLGRLSTYELMADCGNLLVDSDTSSTSCAIYGEPEYPDACSGFPMGGYNCVTIQSVRVRRGEDTHEPDEGKVEAVI